MKLKSTWILILLCTVSLSTLTAQVIAYPVPKELYYARHNDEYTVKVRNVGDKKWIDLYEYNVKVDMDTRSDASMVQFEFSGQIEVMVQKNTGYNENPILIEGYDSQRMIKDILFDNITVNGKKAVSLKDLNVDMGKYTKNIILK